MVIPLTIPQLLIEVGRAIERDKNPAQRLLWLSIAEYLKDARRWRWYREYGDTIFNNLTPEEFDKWVDQQSSSTESQSPSNPVPADVTK